MSRNRIIIIAVIILLLLTFSALVLQNIKLDRDLNNKTEKYFSELEREHSRLEKLNSEFTAVTTDLNEVRKKLYLPERVYVSPQKDISSALASGEKKNKNLPFYLAVDRLKIFNGNLENAKKVSNIVNSPVFTPLIRKYKLELQKQGDNGYCLLKNGQRYFSIQASNEKTFSIVFSDFVQNTKKNFKLTNTIYTKIDEYLKTSLPVINSHFKERADFITLFNSLKTNSIIIKIIKKNHLSQKFYKSASLYNTNILTEDGRTVLTGSLNLNSLTFSIDTKKFNKFTLFYNEFLKMLVQADKRTNSQIRIDNAKAEIIKIARDPVFKKYLQEHHMNLSLKVREDNDYYYFDFFNQENKKQGALGVLKHIGKIYLFDADDVVIASLQSLQYESSKKGANTYKIPDNLTSFTGSLDNTGSLNLILVGSHEKNADTIILVNLNKGKNRIILFSIPRDLYYNNRKINDYYRTYGGTRFSEIISKITGLKITGYIGVDMYAFIDIINILGGIDVNLKSTLIDPTYKVRDNGVWTTLNYDKGMHHLTGIESLRIARSRHTSSDFGRSDRQQLILQGVKDKLNSLNITDMNKVYSIFKTIDEYLDSDISPMEMISLFLTYRNATMVRKDGLSTFNVLYNTYSNIHALKDLSKQYNKNFNRGEWILLPRNDNWNVIKWYINKILKDPEP